MLFVWAQFELQVGIMCASAPSLRVFFRRYLGGSQTSHYSSHGTIQNPPMKIMKHTTIDFEKEGVALRPESKTETHELRELGTPFSEDRLSMSSQVKERDLTRYSHEADPADSGHSSWLDIGDDRGKRSSWRKGSN